MRPILRFDLRTMLMWAASYGGKTTALLIGGQPAAMRKSHERENPARLTKQKFDSYQTWQSATALVIAVAGLPMPGTANCLFSAQALIDASNASSIEAERRFTPRVGLGLRRCQ